ncbi:MAG: 50S ribosomal protein L4 [Candidatus Magasanikbacteria bacterium]|nr:50S ribosomal protein L4 [Candidatus Magasanikbacteria bacterium]
MKLPVYNLTGQPVEEMEAADEIFKVRVKPAVLHSVLVAQQAREREPWAHTKTRGEVRGGGRKPWRQKGTGRARHGSIRSPIWKGGGVTFGPRNVRHYHLKINRTERRLATRMALSARVKEKALYVLQQFSFAEPKTKLLVSLLGALPQAPRTWLILTPGRHLGVMRMGRNLRQVSVQRAEDVSVKDIVNRQAVITTVEGIRKLETLLKKK